MFNSEHEFQKAFYLHVNKHYPELRFCLFAIPNGGDRNTLVAMKLRNEGVVSGIPDMFLCKGGKTFMYELKNGLKKKPSKNQVRQIHLFRREKFPVYVCRNIDEIFWALWLSLYSIDSKFKLKTETIKYLGLTKEEYEYQSRVFGYLYDLAFDQMVIIADLCKGGSPENFLNEVYKFKDMLFDEANGFEVIITGNYKADYLIKIVAKEE